jgi:hypothetical protein
MKTMKWAPALVLAIGLLTHQKSIAQSAEYVDQKTFASRCNVAVATNVTQDDMDYSRKMGTYRYNFCPDGSLMISDYYGNYVTSGSWYHDTKTGYAKFDVGPAAETIYGDWSWLNGEWQVYELGESSMAMKRYDYNTGSTWDVRFEERMMKY